MLVSMCVGGLDLGDRSLGKIDNSVSVVDWVSIAGDRHLTSLDWSVDEGITSSIVFTLESIAGSSIVV